MLFYTEGFLEVAIESWPNWDLNKRPMILFRRSNRLSSNYIYKVWHRNKTTLSGTQTFMQTFEIFSNYPLMWMLNLLEKLKTSKKEHSVLS